MPRTSVTACSSETGCRVTPRASVRVLVSLPQGTSGAQMTNLTPSSEESRPVMPAGLPGVVMRVRLLDAKRVWSSPGSVGGLLHGGLIRGGQDIDVCTLAELGDQVLATRRS